VHFLKQFRRKCLDKLVEAFDRNIPSRVEREHGSLCFSQSGEDGVLNFLCSPMGFYIDVGAHHPFRYSNTHMLYRRGWRGINIDPIPGAKIAFDRFRPGDTNLEMGVGLKKKRARYYSFEEGCFNTLDSSLAKKYIKEKVSKFLGVKFIEILPLRWICKQYVPAGRKIDLLSVDAEGMDTEILRSHDWRRYRPRHVVVEYHHEKYTNKKNPCIYLRNRGYRLVAQTPFSAIFQDSTKG